MRGEQSVAKRRQVTDAVECMWRRSDHLERSSRKESTGPGILGVVAAVRLELHVQCAVDRRIHMLLLLGAGEPAIPRRYRLRLHCRWCDRCEHATSAQAPRGANRIR